MKRLKACPNEMCNDYRQTYYKESDQYCASCGEKLVFVCKYKGCFKPIPDDSHRAYCQLHEAKHKDDNDKKKGIVIKALIVCASAVPVIVKGAASLLKKK